MKPKLIMFNESSTHFTSAIKLLIFDFYKTLGFNVYKIEPREFFAFYKKIGINLETEQQIKEFISLFGKLIGYTANWLNFCKALLQKTLGKADLKKVKELANFYQENLSYKLYDDVKEIISLPYQKAVLTAQARFLLKHLQLEKFATIFTPRETKFLKPDPRAFLAVLEKFKVEPKETLMVGDEIERDLIPAKKLGMKIILIDRDNKIQDPSIKKVSSLTQLKKILV